MSGIDLGNEHGASGDDIAAQWEIASLRAGVSDPTSMLKKISSALLRESKNRSYHSPLHLKRDIKRVPGYASPISSIAQSGSTNTKRMRLPPPSHTGMNLASAFNATSPLAPSYAERKNMGKIEVTLHPELDFKKQNTDENVSIEIHETVKPFLYMNQPLIVKAAQLEAKLCRMQALLCNANDISEDSIARIGTLGQNNITVCGMICCDAPEGKLNAQSILLEGSRSDSNGQRIKLDVSHLESYSLFPGQVILATGLCPEGHTLFAKQLFTKVFAVDHTEKVLGQSTSIIVASGPFTTTSDLSYHPLEDLLGTVTESPPDVLVLMGPFVDAQHPMVLSGHTVFGEGVNATVLTLQEILAYVLGRIEFATKDLKTKVVIVPSTNDATQRVCFPQPAFAASLLTESTGNVLLASNPCSLTVNGTRISISTVDTLFDMSQEEISKRTTGKSEERLVRLARHMVDQASVYPMFPASAAARVDLTQSEAFLLPQVPDLVISSSKLAPFAKLVDQTVCVNPGKLTRGRTGGLFAKLIVHTNSGNPQSAQRTKVEILRI